MNYSTIFKGNLHKVSLIKISFIIFFFYLASQISAQEITVYLFHRPSCPNCVKMKEFLQSMEKSFPDIEIIYMNLDDDRQANVQYKTVVKQLDMSSAGVPLVLIGEYYWLGARPKILENISHVISQYQIKPYEDIVGKIITGEITDTGQLKTVPPDLVNLPIIGEIHLGDMSPVATTTIIAFIDGFNPCSLWVLTLVLGMALHSKKRLHVLAIGLLFLIVTLLIYGGFLFGVVKVVDTLKYSHFFSFILVAFIGFIAFLNIKDYFAWKKGLSFSISDKGGNSFITKLKTLMNPSRGLLPLLMGTGVLAVSAALIELPCTAGFPLLWAQILSGYSVSTQALWWYLTLYLFVYLFDEITILVIVLLTLKRQMMDEKKGMRLKLISGALMASLTIHLVILPGFMRTFLGLLSISASTFVIILIMIILKKRMGNIFL